MNLRGEHEAVHDLVTELLDEVSHAEHSDVVVDTSHGLNKRWFEVEKNVYGKVMGFSLLKNFNIFLPSQNCRSKHCRRSQP